MSRTEIYALARRMSREMKDGFTAAARFLRAVGVAIGDALSVLFAVMV